MYATLNESAFLDLSPESQSKVEAIYQLAGVLKHTGRPPITPSFFDKLYDMSYTMIISMCDTVRYRYSETE